MALIANVNRDPEVIEEPFTSRDFMYDYNAVRDDNTTTKERDNNEAKIKDKKPPKDWERMKQKSQMWVTAMGSK